MTRRRQAENSAVISVLGLCSVLDRPQGWKKETAACCYVYTFRMLVVVALVCRLSSESDKRAHVRFGRLVFRPGIHRIGHFFSSAALRDVKRCKGTTWQT